MGGARFSSIRVRRGESDLWIGWGNGRDTAEEAVPSSTEVGRIAARTLEEVRGAIQDYGACHEAFFESLDPLEEDLEAYPVVAAMLRAGGAASVGPMAAVAGAVAEAVGRSVKDFFGVREIVVENGGDLWIDVRSPLTVSVYAGLSSLSETFGIIVPEQLCPCGLACSSGTVGPSLSFGKADAAVVLCRDAAAADAWATSLGNRLRSAADLEPAVRSILSLADEGPDANSPIPPFGKELKPLGALAVMADRLAAAGSIALTPLERPSAPLRRSRTSGSIGT